MTINFQPKFHREEHGHTGQVWHLTGNPCDPKAQAEQRRLVAEGGIVVWPVGAPGTGFMPPGEIRADVRYVTTFLAVQVAVWALSAGLVAAWKTHPLYAVLLFLGVVPVAFAALIHLDRANRTPPSSPQ